MARSASPVAEPAAASMAVVVALPGPVQAVSAGFPQAAVPAAPRLPAVATVRGQPAAPPVEAAVPVLAVWALAPLAGAVRPVPVPEVLVPEVPVLAVAAAPLP